MDPRLLSRLIATTLLALMASLITSSSASANGIATPRPGDVDTSFGNGSGVVMDPIRGGDTFADMLVDDESRTVLVGSTVVGGQRFPIIGRIVAPGSDTSTLDFYDPEFASGIYGGRVLVYLSDQIGGRSTARLQEPEWGLVPAEADAAFTTVELSRSGPALETETILAGGWVMAYPAGETSTARKLPFVMRFGASGEDAGFEDESFGSQNSWGNRPGLLILNDLNLNGEGWVSSLLPLPDGSILIGITEEHGGVRTTHLVRVDNNGDPEPWDDHDSSSSDRQTGWAVGTSTVTLNDYEYSDLNTLVLWETFTETSTLALVRTVGSVGDNQTRSVSIDTLEIGLASGLLERSHHETHTVQGRMRTEVTSWTGSVNYGVTLGPETVSARSFYLGGFTEGIQGRHGFAIRVSESDSGFPSMDQERFGENGWFLEQETGTTVASLTPVGVHVAVMMTGDHEESHFVVTRMLTANGAPSESLVTSPDLFPLPLDRIDTVSPLMRIPLTASDPTGGVSAILMTSGDPTTPVLFHVTGDSAPSTVPWGLFERWDGVPVPFTGWTGVDPYDENIVPAPLSWTQGLMTHTTSSGFGESTTITTAGVTNVGTGLDYLVISRVNSAGQPDMGFSADGHLWVDLNLEGPSSWVVTQLAVHETSGDIAVVVTPNVLYGPLFGNMRVFVISGDGTEVLEWADLALSSMNEDGPFYRPLGINFQSETSIVIGLLEESYLPGSPWVQNRVGVIQLVVNQGVALEPSFGVGATFFMILNDPETPLEETAHDLPATGEETGGTMLATPHFSSSSAWVDLTSPVDLYNPIPKNTLAIDSFGGSTLLYANHIVGFDGDGSPRELVPETTEFTVSGETWSVQAMSIQDDSITVFALSTEIDGGCWDSRDAAVLSLNMTLLTDTQLVRIPCSELNSERVLITSISRDAAGRFVIAGVNGISMVGSPFIARYTATELDTSFGVSGIVRPVLPPEDLGLDIAVFDFAPVLEFITLYPFLDPYPEVALPWLGYPFGIVDLGDRVVLGNARQAGLGLHPTLVAIHTGGSSSGDSGNTGSGDSGSGDGESDGGGGAPTTPPSTLAITAVPALTPVVMPSLTRLETALTCTIGEFSQPVTQASVRLVINGQRDGDQSLSAGVRSASWPVKPEWAGASVTCEVFVRAGSATSTTQSGPVVIPKAVTPTPTPTADPTTPSTPGITAVRRSVTFAGTTTRMTTPQVRSVRAWAQRNAGVTEVICRAASPTQAGRAQARARARAACAAVSRVHRDADVSTRVKVTRGQSARTVVVTLRIPRP